MRDMKYTQYIASCGKIRRVEPNFDDVENFILDDDLEEILREEAMSGELNEYWKDIIAPNRLTFKGDKNDFM